jgi:hypothetical protein
VVSGLKALAPKLWHYRTTTCCGHPDTADNLALGWPVLKFYYEAKEDCNRGLVTSWLILLATALVTVIAPQIQLINDDEDNSKRELTQLARQINAATS